MAGITRRQFVGGASALFGIQGFDGDDLSETDHDRARTPETVTNGPAPQTQIQGPAPPRQFFLDSEVELVGTVPNRPETVFLYRYENPIPGASGLEVWQGQTRLTQEGRALEAIDAYVWLETLRTLLPTARQVREELTSIVDQTRQIQSTLSGPEQALETAVTQLDRLRSQFEIDVRIRTINVWNALTQAYPTIGTLETAIRQAHGTIEDWLGVARQATSDLPPLIQFLGEAEDPTAVDLDRAAQRIQAGHSALNGLETESTELLNDIEQVERNAEATLQELNQSDDRLFAQIEATVDLDLGLVQGAVNQALQAITNQLRDLVNALFSEVVDPLLSPVREFRSNVRTSRDGVEPSPPPAEQRTALEREWNNRRDASFVVSGTMTMGSLVGLLVLFNSWISPAPEVE